MSDMRHFVNGAYHMATVMSPTVATPSGMTELLEGDDGKCDWCRASDERRAALDKGDPE